MGGRLGCGMVAGWLIFSLIGFGIVVGDKMGAGEKQGEYPYIRQEAPLCTSSCNNINIFGFTININDKESKEGVRPTEVISGMYALLKDGFSGLGQGLQDLNKMPLYTKQPNTQRPFHPLFNESMQCLKGGGGYLNNTDNYEAVIDSKNDFCTVQSRKSVFTMFKK